MKEEIILGRKRRLFIGMEIGNSIIVMYLYIKYLVNLIVSVSMVWFLFLRILEL